MGDPLGGKLITHHRGFAAHDPFVLEKKCPLCAIRGH
jgi:hypothetical protein